MGFLRGKGRGRGALALVFLGLWSAAAGPSSAQRPNDGPGLGRVFVEPRPPLELRRRLAALDVRELPQLFRLVVEHGFAENDGPGLTPLTDEEFELVRQSLAMRPRRELVPFLDDLASRPLELPARLEALALLGGVGSGEHLKLLARLAIPFQERGPLAPELRGAFADALARILERDPAGIAQVPALFSESPPGLSAAIVEAVAKLPSFAATHCLALLLGRAPGLDPLLLARLSERGGKRAPGDELVLDCVRRALRQREPTLISAAALACGELGDDESVEQLVVLMEHPDGHVRESVFRALRKISGLDYGSDAGRWTSWYNAEMRWWDEDAEALLVRIERGHGVDFVRAARLVLEHRLFRARVAESFAQALHGHDASDVLLACRALEELRSTVGVRALIECLDDTDASVRTAAWKALRAITGAELPPESASWAALSG